MAIVSISGRKLPTNIPPNTIMAKFKIRGRKFYEGIREYVAGVTNHFWS